MYMYVHVYMYVRICTYVYVRTYIYVVPAAVSHGLIVAAE